MASGGCTFGHPHPYSCRWSFPRGEGCSPFLGGDSRASPAARENHPSFTAKTDSGSQPALEQLRELIDAGFARLYTDRAAAEQALGGPCYPAPLGDVVKALPGGGEKHRLIQDLRRNLVNLCVALCERQVLPRFGDHAADLAYASARGAAATLILDYKHAFMTVPAAADEARYNCCLVEQPVSRARAALNEDEPQSGTFLVWTVLGFGGRAYPLLYARVP